MAVKKAISFIFNHVEYYQINFHLVKADHSFQTSIDIDWLFLVNYFQQPLPWQNSTLLYGDATIAIEKLKKEGNKNLSIMGSGDLNKTLIKKNLIDEYALLISPIALGKGRRLFQEEEPVHLHLTDTLKSTTGVIIGTYHPKADPA